MRSGAAIIGLDTVRRAASASVEVQDLRFEPEGDDTNKACMHVVVASADHELDFDLQFLMKDQPGDVESTLEHARRRLMTLFEAALASLRKGPIPLR